MAERCFVDTNVLVYAADAREPHKRALAQALLIDLSETQSGVLSTQVLVEYFNALTHKLRVPPSEAASAIRAYDSWAVAATSAQTVFAASALAEQHQLSIWDSLIVQAALDARATTLYSEDMQHGQRFGALQVRNPFVASVKESPT